MDKMIRLIYKAAQELHLPFTFIDEINTLKISLGRKNYYFLFTIPPLNNPASIAIAGNKYALNQLLHQQGFPVPKAISISHEEWSCRPLSELIEGMKFPLVAKPMVKGMRGKDVLCNIKNLETLSDYFTRMIDKHPFIQVEEFHANFKEYRVLILKNKVIGVVERFAATITGDGEHTVEELIAQKNEHRALLSLEMTHAPLVYDEEYRLCLEEQGMNLQSIIPQDKKIRLCYTVNLGRGGDIYSHGKEIHPYNKRILSRLMKSIGLTYAGLDILCEDIHVAFGQNNWFIIEANSFPDLTLHEIPQQGKRASVAKNILTELIYCHPFSYLYHICLKKNLFIVFALSGLITLILLFRFLS